MGHLAGEQIWWEVRETRRRELRQRDGEAQKGNRREEKPDRAEEISEGINHNDDKQAEARSYKEEGENIGEAEINQRKRRNLKC